MVQVENEYGSYGTDTVYMGKIRDQLRDAGFTVPFFTCDGPAQLKNDTRSDIFAAVNFGSDPEGGFSALRAVRPTGPLMVSEYYPGWFDSWGGTHMTGTADKVVKDITYMLDHQASFSIYMVHGGTSFGLWAGANSDPYLPETSSYDYDAPISENGLATPKYYQLRALLQKYLQPGEKLPAVPASIPVQTLAPFYCSEVAPVLDQQTRFIKRDTVLNMESAGEGYGDILYETMLPAGDTATLDVTEIHDYALVYLDDKFIGKLDRRKGEHLLHLPQRTGMENRLRIFVEAMGRVNWGPAMIDRKGLAGAVSLTDRGVTTRLSNWRLYTFPLGEGSPSLVYQPVLDTVDLNQPALYRAAFTTHSQADVFLDLSRFNKGLVWVNGHCLGRYWNIGPTQTMYLPGVWLKNGRNEVVVMDLYKPSSLLLQGLEKPVL
jgi:beta-galactosidase